MPHGVDLLRCLERVRSARNTEESTSCTLSTKNEPDSRGLVPGMTTTNSEQKIKCEAVVAVGALDPGVPYESRWAPYDRIHGPGQGQFPEGSIRPRGYMAPDARHSLAHPM